MMFSVITPTYNRLEMLKKAIKSVMSQDYLNWEHIIVDNNSLDETNNYLRSLNNPKIKYLNQPDVGLVAKSLNMGILNANGDWICFLDSDDIFFKSKLSEISKVIKKCNPDVVYHDLIREKENQYLKMKSKKIKKPYLKNLLIEGNSILMSSGCVKKKVIIKSGLLDEDLIYANYANYDYRMWLKLSKYAVNMKYINKYLGSYYEHGNNISSNKSNYALKSIVAEKSFINVLSVKYRKYRLSRIFFLYAVYKFRKFTSAHVFGLLYKSFKLGSFKYRTLSTIYFIRYLFVFLKNKLLY